MSKKPLVLIGDAALAEMAYEYFTHDSDFEVVAFTVEKNFLKRDVLFGLPVLPFETIENEFPPSEYSAFVSVAYNSLNRTRTKLYHAAKEKGYKLISYVSSRAQVWPNVKMGDNCFIFENNVVQPFVEIGDNVILWSGNHVGHHSSIGDHCFISSHVVVSGYCKVGTSCFIGVNSTIGDNVTIGDDCILGAGSLVLKDTEPAKIFKGVPSIPAKVSSLKFYRLEK